MPNIYAKQRGRQRRLQQLHTDARRLLAALAAPRGFAKCLHRFSAEFTCLRQPPAARVPISIGRAALPAPAALSQHESLWANNASVFVTVTAILVTIVAGATRADAANYSPFLLPGRGVAGTISAAASLFFAFLGWARARLFGRNSCVRSGGGAARLCSL